MSHHRATNRRGERSALAGQFPPYAADGALGARRRPNGDAKPGALFASHATLVALSEKLRVAFSRANSNLIPANTWNSAHGRRLETTGRYKLVAPSWPPKRRTRAMVSCAPGAVIDPTIRLGPDAPEAGRRAPA